MTKKKQAPKEDDLPCGKEKVRCKSLNVMGTKYRTTLNTKFEKRVTWVKPNDLEVRSYIPGTIIRIFVINEQSVKKGDDLMIFEAMKMNNVLKAPYDGKIKEIKVKEGDKVPKGVVLMEYEEIWGE